MTLPNAELDSIALAPLQGAGSLSRFPGVSAAPQPPATRWQPFGLAKKHVRQLTGAGKCIWAPNGAGGPLNWQAGGLPHALRSTRCKANEFYVIDH